MTQSVQLDVQINSPIDNVWKALTDAAILSKWMMFKTNDFKPEVGHTFQFKDAPGYDGVIDCEVTQVDPPTGLAYTWNTVGWDNQQHSSLVTFTLVDAGSGATALHLEQSGFADDATQEYQGAQYGWQMMTDQLKQLVEA